jgi:Uncharacterized protein conserved in bacteria (DUF2252)
LESATFEPSRTRDDPIGLLERQAKTRVPELVPIRHGRMLVSPFSIYRGAAMVMAHDHHGRDGSLMPDCRNSASLSTHKPFQSTSSRSTPPAGSPWRLRAGTGRGDLAASLATEMDRGSHVGS